LLESFVCNVCSKTYSMLLHNDHHIIPKECGGEETVILCVGCHQVVHYLAYRLVSNDTNIESMVGAYLDSEGVKDIKTAANKMINYIQIVAKYMIMLKKGEIETPKKKKKLEINLNQSYKTGLKQLAKNKGIGMEKYALIVLLDHLKGEMRHLEEQINNDILELLGKKI